LDQHCRKAFVDAKFLLPNFFPCLSIEAAKGGRGFALPSRGGMFLPLPIGLDLYEKRELQ
jgi:hypothetical protein